MADLDSPVQMFLDVIEQEGVQYAVQNYAPKELEDEELKDLLQKVKDTESEFTKAVDNFKKLAEEKGFEVDYY